MDSGIVVRPRLVYGAAVWAFVFAGISFYWAAGGSFGANTVGNEVTGFAASNWVVFSIVLWMDGVLKVLLGLLALALVQPWGKRFSRRFLLVSSAVIGFGMAAYGFVELLGTGLSAIFMKLGMTSISPSVDWKGITGHLAIWDPYWLLGGILFVSVSQPMPDKARTRIVGWFGRLRARI